MRTLSFLIKPASSQCNLRCRYCFYADEAAKRSTANLGLMTEATADALLREAYRAVAARGSVSFAFQGGEPTVAGLDFFREFVRKARERKPPSVQISFSIQTNGTLLDDDWAAFFRKEDFLVGLSLDGAAEIHNAHRVDAHGKETWNRVVRAAELLQKHRVKTNTLCVVTGQCARSPQKVYRTLKKLGFSYLQFIACLDPIGEERGSRPWSLTPEAYGRFLCQLFDLWFQDWAKGEYRSIRLFDDYIHLLLGDSGSTCATCGQCGGYFVVEGDGSLYPCDFFVLDSWRLGQLGEESLSLLAEGETFQRFLAWGREKPAECSSCPWRSLCNGGCKNDWITADDGPHNYYCRSFQMLFEHAIDRMRLIAQEELRQRRLQNR